MYLTSFQVCSETVAPPRGGLTVAKLQSLDLQSTPEVKDVSLRQFNPWVTWFMLQNMPQQYVDRDMTGEVPLSEPLRMNEGMHRRLNCFKCSTRVVNQVHRVTGDSSAFCLIFCVGSVFFFPPHASCLLPFC